MPAGLTYMTTDRLLVAYTEIARGVPVGRSSLQPMTPYELGLWASIEETYARAAREGLVVEMPTEWPDLP